VRIDWKPLLKADDDTRLFANTFNMPQELVETAAVRRGGRRRRRRCKRISTKSIINEPGVYAVASAGVGWVWTGVSWLLWWCLRQRRQVWGRASAHCSARPAPDMNRGLTV